MKKIYVAPRTSVLMPAPEIMENTIPSESIGNKGTVINNDTGQDLGGFGGDGSTSRPVESKKGFWDDDYEDTWD